jgi:hypothetical protein
LEKQIGQQVQVVSKLKSQVFGKLPLQAMLSRENKYVITLGGGGNHWEDQKSILTN